MSNINTAHKSSVNRVINLYVAYIIERVLIYLVTGAQYIIIINFIENVCKLQKKYQNKTMVFLRQLF